MPWPAQITTLQTLYIAHLLSRYRVFKLIHLENLHVASLDSLKYNTYAHMKSLFMSPVNLVTNDNLH